MSIVWDNTTKHSAKFSNCLVTTAEAFTGQPSEALIERRWYPVVETTIAPHLGKGGILVVKVMHRTQHARYWEYIPLEHKGQARGVASEKWIQLGGREPIPETVAEAVGRRGELTGPIEIRIKQNGPYWNVVDRRVVEN